MELCITGTLWQETRGDINPIYLAFGLSYHSDNVITLALGQSDPLKRIQLYLHFQILSHVKSLFEKISALAAKLKSFTLTVECLLLVGDVLMSANDYLADFLENFLLKNKKEECRLQCKFTMKRFFRNGQFLKIGHVHRHGHPQGLGDKGSCLWSKIP